MEGKGLRGGQICWVGEVRRAGAADVARIRTLERNGQGRGWPRCTGDHEIPLISGVLLLEKQRKGEGWG